MCILTFWLSASFLSLAHTCFCATYARACELFLFDITYFYFRPSLVVACPAYITSPSPKRSAQTGFIYSRPGISRAPRRLCPRFFFIITPPAFHYLHSGRVFFFFFLILIQSCAFFLEFIVHRSHCTRNPGFDFQKM
ncbi:unnamed protein product [Aphis gossypii]|uniref:Secreted protein n=1 Tax=Aphis gossypii TaxID=80765 RepID=A0A9P0IWN7_APHGO|nr:unnamed protein product [Aphis gossypii]